MADRVSRNQAHRGGFPAPWLAESMRAGTTGLLARRLERRLPSWAAGSMLFIRTRIRRLSSRWSSAARSSSANSRSGRFPRRKSPDSEPHHCWHGARGCGRRGRAVFCFLDHRVVGHGVRGIRRAGGCDAAIELWAESNDEAECEARDGVGGCRRGSLNASAREAFARRGPISPSAGRAGKGGLLWPIAVWAPERRGGWAGGRAGRTFGPDFARSACGPV